MELLFSKSHCKESQVEELILQVKSYLKPRTILFLEGDLGSGKTTFVRLLLESYHYHLANSPTYAFRHTYETQGLKIEHVDLYRLQSEEDIESIGLWDLFSETENLIIVEWGSRVPTSDWPLDWPQYTLKISKADEFSRHYEFYKK